MNAALAEQGNQAGFFHRRKKRQVYFTGAIRAFFPLNFLQIGQQISGDFPFLRASIQNKSHLVHGQFPFKIHKFNEKGLHIAIFYDIL